MITFPRIFTVRFTFFKNRTTKYLVPKKSLFPDNSTLCLGWTIFSPLLRPDCDKQMILDLASFIQIDNHTAHFFSQTDKETQNNKNEKLSTLWTRRRGSGGCRSELLVWKLMDLNLDCLFWKHWHASHALARRGCALLCLSFPIFRLYLRCLQR